MSAMSSPPLRLLQDTGRAASKHHVLISMGQVGLKSNTWQAHVVLSDPSFPEIKVVCNAVLDAVGA